MKLQRACRWEPQKFFKYTMLFIVKDEYVHLLERQAARLRRTADIQRNFAIQ